MSKEPKEDDFEIREQDRWLPIANVGRVMRNALPPQGKLSKEAKECMQECVSEFISFITSQAAEKCTIEKRKTLNGEDILFSMYSLGFENYAETLKIYLAKYREYELAESEARRVKYLQRKERKRKELLGQLDSISGGHGTASITSGKSKLGSITMTGSSSLDQNYSVDTNNNDNEDIYSNDDYDQRYDSDENEPEPSQQQQGIYQTTTDVQTRSPSGLVNDTSEDLNYLDPVNFQSSNQIENQANNVVRSVGGEDYQDDEEAKLEDIGQSGEFGNNNFGTGINDLLDL
ncbi:unnamed protein product [Ambrosiozyma monospora]|uniref:Unnamed protein product n=1 Tax=Ambrosiozyma monospora TaxID=43982 RepID=A0A9W7DJN4_AMBMO|nr:unnamed protein product [Ambrosiozyma monospora]